MEKTQSKYLVGSIICGILTAFGVVASVISMIGGSMGLWYCDLCTLIILALLMFYAFKGYKKPHGNLLKYIILLRAALSLVFIPMLVQGGKTVNILLQTVELGLLCYIAGRLAKAKENLILMILVTACIVAVQVLDIAEAHISIGNVSGLVIWLDICVAYFLRYKEHKEAGLMDAPKE